MHLDHSRTLGSIAASLPGALDVFDDLRIEYCVTGDRSLAEACATHGLDVTEVAARIEEAALNEPGDETGWQDRSLAALVDHIVGTYHALTRSEVGRLARLAAEVRDEPAGADLHEVEALIEQFEAEMIPHLVREERILFPYVVELEARARVGNRRPLPEFGPTNNPLRVMMREHHHAEDTLAELRRVCGGYFVPDDASPAVAALFRGLERLERNEHHHMHLESNVLFRRAIELEKGS